MESTETALTDGVPRSMMVEGMSSLSKGSGGIEMAGDGAEDHSSGLGTVLLLM